MYGAESVGASGKQDGRVELFSLLCILTNKRLTALSFLSAKAFVFNLDVEAHALTTLACTCATTRSAVRLKIASAGQRTAYRLACSG